MWDPETKARPFMQLPDHSPLEPEWESLVQAVAAMITLAPEYVVLQTYTPHDRSSGPYVQTLQEADGAMTLEAVSNRFLEVPLGPSQMRQLADMGWEAPGEEPGLPNYTRFLESEEVEPGSVARFLVLTLRDVYGVTVHDQFECAPQDLFVQVLNGDFGFDTGMRHVAFDIDDWKRRNGR